MGRNYYMVRAMDSTKVYFDMFFNNSIVGVGWSSVDFSKSDSGESLKKEILDACYSDGSTKPQIVGRKLSEAERFKNMQVGDYVLVPYYSNVALAVVDKEELFSLAAADIDLANQREVRYLRKDGELLVIPRTNLSEGLQRRLRVPGSSVSNLYEFRDEIEQLFTDDTYSFSRKILKQEDDKLIVLREELLKRIQSGQTNLQSGGIGLEKLVCELMRIEGYDARVLSKRQFEGYADADIEAVKTDAFSSTKLFVQVKHHSGTSPRSGIQQIIDVLRQPEYEDYAGWFVTSARLSSEDLKFANDNGISVMEGHDLADLIISDITEISVDCRRWLGLILLPTLIEL